MLSALEGEGVIEKRTKKGRLRKFYTSNQIQMQIREERGDKKTRKFCGCH